MNKSYDSFHKNLETIYNESFPVIFKSYKFHRNTYKHWISSAILNSTENKNTLYKKYLKSQTLYDKLKYKNYKNKLTMIIRQSQQTYYSDKFNKLKGNMKVTWKIINNILHQNSSSLMFNSISEISINGQIIKDPKQIANKFNEFFGEYRPRSCEKITHGLSNCSMFDTMPQTNSFSLFLSPCTAFEIITTVSGLANSSGIGVDGFSVIIIKSIIEYLADLLENSFNKSFHLGIFPDCLKQAKITPVHKADDSYK